MSIRGSFLICHGVTLSQSFKSLEGDRVTLPICGECHSALKFNRVSRLPLAKYLYRVNEFHDLTWVEKMVCGKY